MKFLTHSNLPKNSIFQADFDTWPLINWISLSNKILIHKTHTGPRLALRSLMDSLAPGLSLTPGLSTNSLNLGGTGLPSLTVYESLTSSLLAPCHPTQTRNHRGAKIIKKIMKFQIDMKII